MKIAYKQMSYNLDSILERRKKYAWSIATETCLQSKEDPVLIYNRLMKEFVDNEKNLNEINESH